MVVAGLMSLTAMTAQAQVDFKLYFANNIGDVARVSRIIAPNIDPLRGLYEFDINFSLGLRQKTKDGSKTMGQLMRENLKEQDRLNAGIKTYNFKKDGAITHRSQGFFLNIFGEVKAWPDEIDDTSTFDSFVREYDF